VRLKQRKRAASIAIFLQQLGIPKKQSWTTAACGKGWWLRDNGLVNLLDPYVKLQH
jgi:hypothetical protein